jgi:23S rRNA (adenine2030-N6)-methyltransferase
MRRVPSPPSRYRAEGPADYSHRFHAGNVGDVWKHCVLVEVLRRARTARADVTYVESHAGAGRYALGPTGEWTEGVGRVWSGASADDAIGRYVTFCRALGAGEARPESYPGSPLLAHAVLRGSGKLRLWEQDQETAEQLRAAFAGDGDVAVTVEDGLPALLPAVRDAEASGRHVVALVDPPFTQKPDWITVPDALIAAANATQHATLLLWYPLKSLTRPNAMIARLKAAGVSATVAELVTTPLEHQRQRLNGSGMILVRPPDGALEMIAAAAPVLGGRCATRPGVWSSRMVSW